MRVARERQERPGTDLKLPRQAAPAFTASGGGHGVGPRRGGQVLLLDLACARDRDHEARESVETLR